MLPLSFSNDEIEVMVEDMTAKFAALEDLLTSVL